MCIVSCFSKRFFILLSCDNAFSRFVRGVSGHSVVDQSAFKSGAAPPSARGARWKGRVATVVHDEVETSFVFRDSFCDASDSTLEAELTARRMGALVRDASPLDHESNAVDGAHDKRRLGGLPSALGPGPTFERHTRSWYDARYRTRNS